MPLNKFLILLSLNHRTKYPINNCRCLAISIGVMFLHKIKEKETKAEMEYLGSSSEVAGADPQFDHLNHD